MTAPVAQRSPAERARWYTERGRRFLQSGDLDRAREVLRRAVFTDTLALEPYWQLMLCASHSRTEHRFSVVVTTWNRCAELHRCLESLRTRSFFKNELIVVDNASRDGTVDYLQAQPDLRLILNRTQVSVSRATNQGFSIATGDFVGLLNDDTEVMPGWDLAIVETLASERRVGAAVPLVVFPDGTVQSPGQYNGYWSPSHSWIGRVPHADTTRVVRTSLADHPSLQHARECDYGIFPFLTRACFDRIGGFDEQFEHYFADPDLGYRVQQAGSRNLYCPTSVIVHRDLSSQQPARRGTRFESTLCKFVAKWDLRDGPPPGAGPSAA